jgi:hypothetical protein
MRAYVCGQLWRRQARRVCRSSILAERHHLRDQPTSTPTDQDQISRMMLESPRQTYVSNTRRDLNSGCSGMLRQAWLHRFLYHGAV